ncbi:ribokinase [Jiella endophytica]|uniref:Ribokinase n=1 Tax=Jiella endophytica TaxID=2558362 RepID=A0A4Y8RN89_9HYPH|nr:ribokinase [Jiella endophytica]TFF24806.1 ribokinase [Jiella endophytica]
MTTVHVLGNATVDVVQRVGRLPAPGETLLSAGLERCAGGKGLNQAVAAARAGARTRLNAPIGKDADATFLRDALCGEAGLSVEWRVLEAPTDISSIWVSADGENMIVSSAASATGLAAAEALAALSAMEEGDILVLQGNLSAETTMAAASFARDRGARVILNTAPIAWDMRPLLPLADVLVANGPEARHITGLSTAEAVQALLGHGCRTVVVTRGAEGAWLGNGDGLVALSAPKVSPVDTAGAGDVAVGTLAAMLAEGLALSEALGIALKAASLSVTRPGTMPSFPTADEILAQRAS